LFRCQLCREVVPPNTRPIRRVVETRDRQYPFRPKANRFKRKPRPDDPERKKGRIRYRDDPGGSGREIVREALLCPACGAGRH
jgi:hypothetical protein